ncbi:hypothetical protein [Vagococcus fluvialis]|uniref:hypothetical protein n=1 Tax=Vagococcus fluvialis TaxID=2738 RepID=UPI001D0A393D|nr:hypothetical protein [Vagococcus fluvialis]MDT2747078.1 hypothetical protein [Vagococcus fluvialis]UDM72381.1 hypothetical protein K5L00_06605 [Vagococcus fluvialis]UDM77246.1 hypothetical protein K5K98_02145 [Vagococcus fluvialis]UDM81516.1 hypothetical protein K5K96_09080 [Vagococcus fluvialis]
MSIFGIPIGEVGALLGIIVTISGAVMFLFRAIVISPLQTSIDRLEDSISNFSEQLDESKRDRGILHQRINKLDTRVTVLEEHDKWEDNKK